MLADNIDALLPQTQCTRCGYAGCRPYAEAIETGAADINQCPPGGQETIVALAALLHRESRPLNPENGVEGAPTIALIDETRCIGCAKCLPPCPVDAIVGAPRRMHTVVAELCTGCELCIAPCPVDCITMIPSPAPRVPAAALNRQRFEAHNTRTVRRGQERATLLSARKEAAHAQGSSASAVSGQANRSDLPHAGSAAQDTTRGSQASESSAHVAIAEHS